MAGRDDAHTRAETVGTMLRPDAVRQVMAPDGQDGQDGRAERILDGAVIEAIAIQEQAGLDVITDGEMRRWAWAQTPRFLDCFERRRGGGPEHNWRGGAPLSGAGPAPDMPFPVAVRRVSQARRTGDMAAEYAFLARHAHTRAKYSMAAPSYHRRYWSDTHSGQAYGSCEESSPRSATTCAG